MAPQLTLAGRDTPWPIDFSADIPLFPPAACALCVVAGLLLRRISGRRASFLPQPLSSVYFRLAVVAAVAAACVGVLNPAGNALRDAGSGVDFTPVSGLATAFPYTVSRNPMYLSLLVVVLPGAAVLFDTAWVLAVAPVFFFYQDRVVIAAEEALLKAEFGEEYAQLTASVPRWLLVY